MELAWTVIPILIVIALALATARVIASVQDAPRPPGAETELPKALRAKVSKRVLRKRFWPARTAQSDT